LFQASILRNNGEEEEGGGGIIKSWRKKFEAEQIITLLEKLFTAVLVLGLNSLLVWTDTCELFEMPKVQFIQVCVYTCFTLRLK
jgi:hypothetical protein